MNGQQERHLFETVIFAADTLVSDFDLIDFLEELADRCASVCQASDVGIVLATPRHQLVVVASTSERVHAAEALQLAAGHGPAIDSYASGEVVSAGSADEISRRWPALRQLVSDSSYISVHAVPLCLRKETIDSLTFFRDEHGRLNPSEVRAAQTIADVATIGVLQERANREASAIRDQLEHASRSQIVIEQAKGIIAHSHGVDIGTAWQDGSNVSWLIRIRDG